MEIKKENIILLLTKCIEKCNEMTQDQINSESNDVPFEKEKEFYIGGSVFNGIKLMETNIKIRTSVRVME